eukprot:6195147-Pleurochrysis_carterae.AAC.1
MQGPWQLVPGRVHLLHPLVVADPHLLLRDAEHHLHNRQASELRVQLGEGGDGGSLECCRIRACCPRWLEDKVWVIAT